MALLVVHGAPSAEKGAIVGKRVKASMAIAIELSDHLAQTLSEAASRLQVPEAELAAAAVLDLLAHQSADFDAAAQRVLEKNQEIYRRLA
jgi:predicted transcriptional regulator